MICVCPITDVRCENLHYSSGKFVPHTPSIATPERINHNPDERVSTNIAATRHGSHIIHTGYQVHSSPD